MKSKTNKMIGAQRRTDGPPQDALERLIQFGSKGVVHARHALGICNSIVPWEGMENLFPDFRWSQGHLAKLPLNERRAACRLLDWARHSGVNVAGIIIARQRLVKTVHAFRRNSPFGRKCRLAVARLRRRLPKGRGLKAQNLEESFETVSTRILDRFSGRPLTPGVIRIINGFNPTSIHLPEAEERWKMTRYPGVALISLEPDGFSIRSMEMVVSIKRRIGKPRKIEGRLEDFFQTGTEGLVWSVVEEDEMGYDGLHEIQEGDHLTIADQLGHKIWAGTIRCDRESGWRRYPTNPKYGQPNALGYWIHWTQKGFKPNDWARLFVRPEYERLRGTLVRRSVERGRNRGIRRSR
jgi:hypothetical protein